VTVVMPLRNRAAEAPAALDSVLAQDFDQPFEVVAVDDGSTDRTRDVVGRYGDVVRLISVPASGVAAARNAGVAAARGEYLAYCDSDDVQRPFRLAAQAAALDRFPDAALVCSDMTTWHHGETLSDSHLRARWLGPSARPLDEDLARAFPTVTTCRDLGLPVPDALAHRRVFAGRVAPLVALINFTWSCVTMARTQQVRNAGGHWEGVGSFEDWCLAGELAKRHPIVFLDFSTCLYRIHDGQTTGNLRRNMEDYRDVVLRVWRQDEEFYRANSMLVDRLVGTAYASLGELDACDHRWSEAERNFVQALKACPRQKRAWLNLGLAALRHRVPGLPGSRVDQLLPACIAPGRRQQA
jgi:glycosyltransferase involved in cell wall biosynthesis